MEKESDCGNAVASLRTEIRTKRRTHKDTDNSFFVTVYES
jgi:hypothetical protein